MELVSIEELRLTKEYKNYFAKCSSLEYLIPEDAFIPMQKKKRSIGKEMIISYMRMLSNQIK